MCLNFISFHILVCQIRDMLLGKVGMDLGIASFCLDERGQGVLGRPLGLLACGFFVCDKGTTKFTQKSI